MDSRISAALIKSIKIRYLLPVYFIVLFVYHYIFTNLFFNIDFLGTKARLFSYVFIPILTLMLHLVLLRLIPIWVFTLLLGVDAIVDLVASIHWLYFAEPPSLLSFVGGANEAAAAAGAAIALIPWRLVGLLAAKIVILVLIGHHLKTKLKWRLIILLNWAIIPLMAMALWIRPPSQAASYTTYGVCIKVHGLYLAAGENLFFHYFFKPPLDPPQADNSTKIDTINMKIPCEYLDNPIIIQLESLDYLIINKKCDNRFVTPFFESLRDWSLFLRIDPKHTSIAGSSGADFQFLAQRHVIPGVLPASEKETENIQTLPKSLKKEGIRTIALHGNSAKFWGRDRLYKRLGVEEFIDVKKYPIADGGWGVSDSTFFANNAQQILNYKDKPTLFFMITLSSHAPFNFVENRVFEHSGIVYDYFNVINYADQCVSRFIKALPGKHLVIIYGDHSANIISDVYNSRIDGKEAVPGFVFLVKDGEIQNPTDVGLVQPSLTGNYTIISLSKMLQDLEAGRKD